MAAPEEVCDMGTQLIKTPLENGKKLLGCTSGHVEPAGRSNVEFEGC